MSNEQPKLEDEEYQIGSRVENGGDKSASCCSLTCTLLIALVYCATGCENHTCLAAVYLLGFVGSTGVHIAHVYDSIEDSKAGPLSILGMVVFGILGGIAALRTLAYLCK